MPPDLVTSLVFAGIGCLGLLLVAVAAYLEERPPIEGRERWRLK